jgi:hypothetical protein
VSVTVTLELPDDLAQRAKGDAAAKGCRMEDVVLDWLQRGAFEPDVSALSNSSLFVLSSRQMPESEQHELSVLLASHRDHELDGPGRDRLAALMDRYRRDLIVMARANSELSRRSLKP